jgi:hypothetical protein
MRTNLITVIAILWTGLLGPAIAPAQEIPAMPAPVKEHQWLQQFVGDWESEVEIHMDPAQPPLKSKGSETVRALGGFWIVGEGKGEMMGMPYTHLLTLGYDPAQQKYVGTWVDSNTSLLWKYVGEVDATGKILTLEAEGPCPLRPGTLSKFRDVTEFKSADHRVFTSSMLGEDGKWMTMVKGSSTRKK